MTNAVAANHPDQQARELVRLPNSLAYVVAVFALIPVLILPFALAVADLSPREAVDGFYVHSFVLFAVLGVLILWRRPGHAIGWLLVGTGGFDAIFRLGGEYELFGLDERRGFPSLAQVYLISGWTWVPAVAGVVIALPLMFPDGRLLSRRWRPLAISGLLATVVLSAVDAVSLTFDVGATIESLAYLLFGAVMLASLVPLVVRYRRSHTVERQQFKWVLIGLAFSVPATAIGTVGSTVGMSGALTLLPLVVIPVTITVAVLRYRLYDIDIVINKAVVFVVLVGFITVVYAAIVVGLGRLLPFGEGNLVLAVVATAVVAVAFEPVRARVQHWANRLVYGRRSTPYETLAAMTASIGEAADPSDALAEAARLLAEGTGAAQAVVWVARDGVLTPRATAGDVVDEPAPVPLVGGELPAMGGVVLVEPVRHEGKLVGALSLAKRPGEGVNTTDRRLVAELAGQAALLLANTRLRSRLGDRLVELRVSRQRMITAQDRARHALERDLHDGAQQELVALKVKLGLARTIATREGDTETAQQLASTVAIADRAVDTLRDVARGIYPPLLESEGLAAALSTQARRADLAVTVLDRAGTRYPRELEATAYFCALEALRNADRHANADNAHIELNSTATNLVVTITDDGDGYDPDHTPRGDGLTHMADRIDATGGTLDITTQPGHGTTITLNLPTPGDGPNALDGAEPILQGVTA